MRETPVFHFDLKFIPLGSWGGQSQWYKLNIKAKYSKRLFSVKFERLSNYDKKNFRTSSFCGDNDLDIIISL